MKKKELMENLWQFTDNSCSSTQWIKDRGNSSNLR